jgi:hypothetical protein
MRLNFGDSMRFRSGFDQAALRTDTKQKEIVRLGDNGFVFLEMYF